MAEKELGTVASRNGKYHVKWNDSGRQVYVKKCPVYGRVGIDARPRLKPQRMPWMPRPLMCAARTEPVRFADRDRQL
jgi:hypothetical protein